MQHQLISNKQRLELEPLFVGLENFVRTWWSRKRLGGSHSWKERTRFEPIRLIFAVASRLIRNHIITTNTLGLNTHTTRLIIHFSIHLKSLFDCFFHFCQIPNISSIVGLKNWDDNTYITCIRTLSSHYYNAITTSRAGKHPGPVWTTTIDKCNIPVARPVNKKIGIKGGIHVV